MVSLYWLPEHADTHEFGVVVESRMVAAGHELTQELGVLVLSIS